MLVSDKKNKGWNISFNFLDKLNGEFYVKLYTYVRLFSNMFQNICLCINQKN